MKAQEYISAFPTIAHELILEHNQDRRYSAEHCASRGVKPDEVVAILTKPDHEKAFANQLGYTDVYPFEVIRKVSEKCLEIRGMSAELEQSWKPDFIPGGFAGHCTNQRDQKWIITSDESARIFRIRLGKKGWKCRDGNRFTLADEARKFHDYNF